MFCPGFDFKPYHVHILLKAGATPIATPMRRLLTGFWKRNNKAMDVHMCRRCPFAVLRVPCIALIIKAAGGPMIYIKIDTAG
jgi:hypothetical protein